MIRNFNEHAANERTFLAWVRTAIAVMAFGFIVEKFDLFLEISLAQTVNPAASMPQRGVAKLAGLLLIVVGTAMVAIAAFRFRRTATAIDAEELRHISGARADLALALLLFLLGCALLLYLSHSFRGVV